MSNPVTAESGPGPKKHVPFVPENMEMKEFTLRAVHEAPTAPDYESDIHVG